MAQQQEAQAAALQEAQAKAAQLAQQQEAQAKQAAEAAKQQVCSMQCGCCFLPLRLLMPASVHCVS